MYVFDHQNLDLARDISGFGFMYVVLLGRKTEVFPTDEGVCTSLGRNSSLNSALNNYIIMSLLGPRLPLVAVALERDHLIFCHYILDLICPLHSDLLLHQNYKFKHILQALGG